MLGLGQLTPQDYAARRSPGATDFAANPNLISQAVQRGYGAGTQAQSGGGSWWDQNPYSGAPATAATGSTPVASPQAQIDTGGGQYPLSSVSGSGFLAPWTTAFNAPSVDQMRNDPQYQFALGEGLNQIQRSAAAKGTLLTGGTMKDLTAWSQGLASQQFDKIYNRANSEYKDAYNIFKNNQNDQWNRLSGLAGIGQTTAGQLQNAGGNYGALAGQNITGAGNAQAAATAGSGSVWGGTLGTLGNIGSDLAMRNPAWNRTPGYVNEMPQTSYVPPVASAPGAWNQMPQAPVGYAG